MWKKMSKEQGVRRPLLKLVQTSVSWDIVDELFKLLELQLEHGMITPYRVIVNL